MYTIFNTSTIGGGGYRLQELLDRGSMQEPTKTISSWSADATGTVDGSLANLYCILRQRDPMTGSEIGRLPTIGEVIAVECPCNGCNQQLVVDCSCPAFLSWLKSAEETGQLKLQLTGAQEGEQLQMSVN